MSSPCEQADNIKHIETDLANHKAWRSAVSGQLSSIEVQLARLNERLDGKLSNFDNHVKDGNAFRAALFITILGLIGTFCTGFIAYGRMEQKVDFVYAHTLKGEAP